MIDKIIRTKNIIERPVYTEKIMPFVDKDIIKVLTGQRRVGKSYILFQLINEIRKKNPDANIIYVNKELKPFEHICDDSLLYDCN